jgi:uncharacterized protein (DUF302 family)
MLPWNLTLKRQIGLLLPCNVVIRADPDAGQNTIVVDALNPQIMGQLIDQPEMREIANDVTTKLQAAIESLKVPSITR